MKNVSIFSVILAVFISVMSLTSVSAQTRQERRQIANLEKEISRLKFDAGRIQNQVEDTTYYINLEGRIQTEISRLKSDTTTPGSVQIYMSAKKQLAERKTLLGRIQKDHQAAVRKNKNLIDQANGLYSRIGQLEKSRKVIFDRYTTTTSIPREMTQNTTKRRLQANVIRREESSLDVLEHLPIYGDMVDTTIRFKVVLENTMMWDVTILVKPVNGGLEQSIVLSPGTMTEINLIPGSYQAVVKANNTGRLVGTGPLTVSRVVRDYKGIECHGFVTTPKY